MTYELALKLKEAGFPQDRLYDEGHCAGCYCSFSGEDEVYWPSLSVLIEACGDKFCSLMKYDKSWFCGQLFIEDGKKFQENTSGLNGYKTPEEAVANLYLALHKNV